MRRLNRGSLVCAARPGCPRSTSGGRPTPWTAAKSALFTSASGIRVRLGDTGSGLREPSRLESATRPEGSGRGFWPIPPLRFAGPSSAPRPRGVRNGPMPVRSAAPERAPRPKGNATKDFNADVEWPDEQVHREAASARRQGGWRHRERPEQTERRCPVRNAVSRRGVACPNNDSDSFAALYAG